MFDENTRFPSTAQMLALAETISAEKFELFLRAYITRQIKQLPMSCNYIMFNASIGNPTKDFPLGDGNWQLDYAGSGATKGEILAECLDEYVRRRHFEATCKLKLIAHNSEETPA